MSNSQFLPEFIEKGIIRLNNILPRDRVENAVNEVFLRLKTRGLWSGKQWNHGELAKISLPIGVSKLIGRISNESVFGELITPELLDIINVLCDSNPLCSPARNGQVLMTLPEGKEWKVPHDNWHLDISRLPGIGMPGVQVFTFLTPVMPKGGGTLAISGSHKLLNGEIRFSSKQVRNQLKCYPFFRDLMDANFPDRNRFLYEAGKAENIPLQVVEIHGNPCDVYIMDMRVLHTISYNADKSPRVMWTKRFFKEKAYNAM